MDGASLQEALAIAVAVLAGLYVVKRLTGWPRLRPRRDRTLVQPRGRLARGLDKARQRRD